MRMVRPRGGHGWTPSLGRRLTKIVRLPSKWEIGVIFFTIVIDEPFPRGALLGDAAHCGRSHGKRGQAGTGQALPIVKRTARRLPARPKNRPPSRPCLRRRSPLSRLTAEAASLSLVISFTSRDPVTVDRGEGEPAFP